jgi:hypothetical protein
MRHTIWDWIVEADEWIGEAALDAMLAMLIASVATESLRFVVAFL